MNARLAILSVSFLIVSTACMQTQNSSSNDRFAFADNKDLSSKARQVLTLKCGDCHDFHTQTDAQLILSRYITPGNPSSSEIYYRIKGSESPTGPKDMPKNEDIVVTADDLAILRGWISAITP